MFILFGVLGFLGIVGIAGYVLSGASDPTTLFDQIEQLNNEGVSPDQFLGTILDDPGAGLFDSVANYTNNIISGDLLADTVDQSLDGTLAATDPNPQNDVILKESPDIISEEINKIPDVITDPILTNETSTITEPVLNSNDTAAIEPVLSITDQLALMGVGEKLSLASELNGGEFTQTQRNLFLNNSDILDSFILERYN